VTITFILPIRNEAAYIERSLASISKQDYISDDMEVLVVDGMSTDGTREIVQKYMGMHPNIHLLDNPSAIVPTGMNIALRQAKGGIIIRVDGHCIIASDYLRKCVEHIQRDGVDGVGGPMMSIGDTYLAKAIAIGMSSSFGVGNSTFRTTSGKTMLVDTVPFPAYTRQIIERAGLYDEELVRNQDDEYNYRIHKLGGRILLAEDVRSTYFSRGSWNALRRQYFQYGYWKVRVLQKHPYQMSLRQFIPPAFVLSLFISSFLVILPTVLRPWSMVIPFVYLSANLLASLVTACRRGWKYLPLLPLVFASLHLSYGSGFLVGLLKFWDRWGDKTGRVPAWSSKVDG
jgi:succinoglycan biosynthesis protein ExoA